jgi:pcfD
MSNYKLVTIDQRFIAETIARTGTYQILEKASRNYVGLYNEEENWYIPLRAKIKVNKIPNSFYYETPFKTENQHFKNPGLDFQKALYVPKKYILDIENTLPKEQSDFIFNHQEEIQNKFEEFVLLTANSKMSDFQLNQNTVNLFPEGIEKIKQLQQRREEVKQELKSFTLNNVREEIKPTVQSVEEEYTFTTNEKEIESFRTPLSENIKSESAVFSNEQINTMTLQKLNNDIKNYLSSTEKDKSLLHEKDEKKHIEYMQKLFDSLENKPGFITQNKLDSYAAELGVMDLTTAIKNDNKKAIKEILAAGIKEYLQSDTYKNFLNFASSMHQYSQKNLRLILSQYPNASLIASHTDWKAKGRYINKGSKAIRVYAPIFGYKKDEEGNFIKDEKGRKIPTGEIVAWRLAPVFDVSQTNGKEIPKQLYELTENFKSPEAFTSIFNAVKKCTTATVSFGNMELSPGARGYYIPSTHEIVIKKGMSSYQTLKTEIHEVVHSVLHNKQNEFIPAAQMEFEAESVAYIVCNHFGVDTSDYSFGYLSSWTEAGSKLEEFEQSLATICNTAKSLITQIEKEINQELNIKENKVQEKLNPYQEKIRKAQEQLKVQSENKTEQNNLVKK